jgi:hypothetical protein
LFEAWSWSCSDEEECVRVSLSVSLIRYEEFRKSLVPSCESHIEEYLFVGWQSEWFPGIYYELWILWYSVWDDCDLGWGDMMLIDELISLELLMDDDLMGTESK